MDGRRYYVCVFLLVTVSVCLRTTVCLGTKGLPGWIRQKPGAVLCTIRIKDAISGCYLLRDVLCSQFWWPPPLKSIKQGRDGLCGCWVTVIAPVFTSWPPILGLMFICLMLAFCEWFWSSSIFKLLTNIQSNSITGERLISSLSKMLVLKAWPFVGLHNCLHFRWGYKSHAESLLLLS